VLAQARQDLQAELDVLESRWLELGELLA
jgi:hypothetical protein